MSFYEDLLNLDPGIVLKDEPMSGHTTFRIGGPADFFVVPSDADALMRSLELCRKAGLDHMIVGNGSNLLVGDKGYRGVIFDICRTMDSIQFEEEGDSLVVNAGAGIMLASLARQVCQKGYGGFEFATGIPGTLGGGVAMNCGAYGGEIGQVLLSVEVLDEANHLRTIDVGDLHLTYRNSDVLRYGLVVVSAKLAFVKGDEKAIMERVAELSAARKDKQPLEYASAGSTFKRPEGYFAGKLIQDCGLKGFHMGDAWVSEKHAGFVVNKGNASAADIRALMDHVVKTVEAHFGVVLQPEIRFVGDF